MLRGWWQGNISSRSDCIFSQLYCKKAPRKQGSWVAPAPTILSIRFPSRSWRTAPLQSAAMARWTSSANAASATRNLSQVQEDTQAARSLGTLLVTKSDVHDGYGFVVRQENVFLFFWGGCPPYLPVSSVPVPPAGTTPNAILLTFVVTT